MPRIPDETIDRLKQEVSLQRLAEARGIELKRHGADLIGLCPFHEDREPSLVISPNKNLWHCLGACQTGGSVIDWVMRAQGVSFRHAVELLRADHPSLAQPAAPVKQTTVRKLPPPIDCNADDAQLLAQVIGFYHDTLKRSPEALAYLGKRGLTHPEMVERFQLGYANRTLGLRLPASNREAGAEMRGRLRARRGRTGRSDTHRSRALSAPACPGRSRHAARPARPRAAGDLLRHRDAPYGDRQSEAVRHRRRPGHKDRVIPIGDAKG